MGAAFLRARRRDGVALGLSVLLSCSAHPFDTTRADPPQGTLGEEVFRIVCERVHYGETRSDVTFERGRVPCVRGLGPNESAPGVGPKTNFLGRVRRELSSSLDLAMPDALHRPLDRLLVDLLPFYGPDGRARRDAMGRPLVGLADGGTAVGEDLLPRTTRSTASFLQDLAVNSNFLRAVSRGSQRQGYRPPTVSIGLLRPVLGFPQVDEVLGDTLRLVREGRPGVPEGRAHGTFNTLLSTLRGEMATAGSSTETRGGTTLDATLDLLFRSETSLAAARQIPLVRRDARGVAVVNVPRGESVPAPFADADADGLADIDPSRGYYVRNGQRVNAPSPFPARFTPNSPRDDQGRAVDPSGRALYRYSDLDQTLLGAAARQLPPLLRSDNPDRIAGLQLLHGLVLFLGNRAMASRAYPGAPTVNYSQLDAVDAPVVDLVNAFGMLLTHRDAPQYLALGRALMAPEREAVTARLVSAMLAVEAISDRQPGITMEHRAVIWDEVMDVLRRIGEEPGLLEDLLAATAQTGNSLGSAGLFQPRCAGSVPAQNLSRAYGAYMRNRDRVQPAWTGNLNAQVDVSLRVLVDRALPDTQDLASPGSARDNRSTMQRIFHLVDDLNGSEICNRPGARILLVPSAFGIPLLQPFSIPGLPTYDSCQLLRVPDAAVFFARAAAGGGRAILAVQLGGFLNTVTDAARRIGINIDRTLDNLIERQSGITGLTSQPTPFAVARLVFHPSPSPFITALTDPPLIRNSEGITGANPPREFRASHVHQGSVFAWESYCFYDSMRPLITAFVRHDRQNGRMDPRLAPGADPESMAPSTIDASRGSRLFVDLLAAMHRHWATRNTGEYQSATRCQSCRPGQNFSLMSGAGRYEPIVGEALDGDILPALAAATAELQRIQLPGGRTGLQAMASLVRALVDPNALAMDGQRGWPESPSYRDGRTNAVWNDGNTPSRATLFSLFADAFNAMDPRDGEDSATNPRRDEIRLRRTNWTDGRSSSVDHFLTIEGTGSSARFRNRAIPGITRLFVSWLEDRVETHRATGDLVPWGRGLGPRFGTAVRGPVFASAIDLTFALYDDRAARERVTALLLHILDERSPSPTAASPFATTLTGVADLFQLMRADGDVDPILRAVAPAFAPDTGTVPVVLRFLDRARDVDRDRALTRVLTNFVQRPPGDDPNSPEPLTAIADGIADTQRERPGERGPLSGQDTHLMLRSVVEFLTDRSRGMEQFYFIVNNRRLPQ